MNDIFNPHFKYKHFFVLNPRAIVEIAREKATWQPDIGKAKNRQNWKDACALLASMGLNHYYHYTILKGTADIEADEEGWLTYIDHQVSNNVMDRLMGDEGEKRVHYRPHPCYKAFNSGNRRDTDNPKKVTCFKCRAHISKKALTRLTK